MSNIRKRLDEMKETIQKDDFIAGRDLSNEVNIRMFCYDPKDEMVVRDFTKRLENEVLKYKVHIVDLYDIFLSICEDKRIINRIPQLEERKGKTFLANQLEKSCNATMFAKKITEEFDEDKDLLLIAGVGKIFPFMRIHTLLNVLQEDFNNKPIVVLYPGTFDGHCVKLFNKLKANEYYRAFNMI